MISMRMPAANPNGNSNPYGVGGNYSALDTGSGLISFIENSRWGLGTGFPTGTDYWPRSMAPARLLTVLAAVQQTADGVSGTPVLQC